MDDQQFEFDDAFDYEWDPTPEEVREIERGIQEANMGLVYEFLKKEDGRYVFKCNKCGRIGSLVERPFPHRFDCPMKRL